MSNDNLYGARVYFFKDGVILVKQTIKKNRDYVIDMDSNGKQREKHVDPGDDRMLGEVVRLAGEGKL